MNQRINISLPGETLRLLDRVAAEGDRSRLIDQEIRFYIDERDRAKLKKQVKEGALRRAERDLSLVEEWFPLEEELWHEPHASPPPDEERFTSWALTQHLEEI